MPEIAARTQLRTVVLGGGLAGITAALDCTDAGRRVTLLETKPRLGGLTTSFPHGDLIVDNGQHVFLRCCTSYRLLLERLGVGSAVTLQNRLDVPVLEPGGKLARIRRRRLPAPLHLGSALLRYRPLTLGRRLRILPAALALRRVDPTAPAIDEQSFGDWLARHGQDQRTVAALWDLVGIATLNAPAAQTSLALAATVFQRGLLQQAAAGDIGWSLVPLDELHGKAAAAALGRAGATVRLRAKAERLSRRGGEWVVGLAGGESVPADEVVVALPPRAAERLLPPGAAHGAAGAELSRGWSERLGAAPIVNVHVRYDRRVLDQPFVAGLGTPVQFVFDRTAQSGPPAGQRSGQYLAVSLSAADQWVDLPVARLREIFLPALADLLPAARNAEVRDFFVTREREATFRPSPGSRSSRPVAATGLPGLVLAGAHTDTGWPATMEGAVRSGSAASRVLLDGRAADRTPRASRPAVAA